MMAGMRGNPPYENGLGAIAEGKGYNASLRPDSEFTHIYQMNPVDEKRLLKKRSHSDSTNGAAGHPVSIQPDGSGSISQRACLSVDVEPLEKRIGKRDNEVKKRGVYAGPMSTGIQSVLPDYNGILRQFLLGTRGLLEGAGSAGDYVRTPLNWINGYLGGNPEYFRNPGSVLSDSMDLPVPQNETEKKRVGLNQGISNALVESLGGMGLAKYGTGNVAEFGRFLADNPIINSTFGGLLGLFSGGDR